jgi:hypothetical protein
METLEKILILAVAPGSVIAAMTWILREMFSRSLSRDLEVFRAELGRRASELSLIHEKRAEVIGDIYGKLARARKLMSTLPSVMEVDDSELSSKRKRAEDAYNDADDYFNEHRLYLGEELGQKVDNILSTMDSAYQDYHNAHATKNFKASSNSYWTHAYEQINKELPPIFVELEKEFQTVLKVGKKEL